MSLIINSVNELLFKLEEIWVEELENAADKKVQEECLPGKPMSVLHHHLMH